MAFGSDTHAIIGLGVTDQGRVPGKSSADLRIEALQMAIADAGLEPKDVGGYVYQAGIVELGTVGPAGHVPKLAGMSPNLIWEINSGGVSTIACITAACAAIDSGAADYVAVGYGDTALSGSTLVGQVGLLGDGTEDTMGAFGMYSPGADHALAAQRHMHDFGTTKEQFGAIALNARAYANERPDAYMHERPMTMDDYLGARMIADPLGKFDYCLVADGGCAFIVTSADRAKDAPKKAASIAGVGFGHSIAQSFSGDAYREGGVGTAAAGAYKTAGIGAEDVDVAEIYDCFTITVMMALEGCGFAPRGEGGAFVEEGNLRPGGAIPTNTGGGELSWSYMQGFTPMVEGIRQVRGEGGPTQQPDVETCLITGHGGTTKDAGHMEYADACMILQGV